MIFNNYSYLEGKHAYLSPSSYHWINYDEEKLLRVYSNFLITKKGTELHDFAATCIKLKQKLPRSKKTLNMYVNDAIGFKMTPEQILYYSENCFGTADSISFRDNVLRIHDLKTGVTPGHIEQLLIYSALFCLEYKYDPFEISIILRIYQFDEINEVNPDPSDIKDIMEKIKLFDKLLNEASNNEE